MVQHVHLHDSFLHIHGLDHEVLRLDDRIFLARVPFIRKRHIILEQIRLQTAIAEAAGQLRLMLMNLALQFLYHQVNGRIHIHGSFFTAEQETAFDRHRDLNDMAALRDRQQDLDVAHFVEVLRYLANALLYIFAQGRGNLDILASYRECCHKTHPLSCLYWLYSAQAIKSLLFPAKKKNLCKKTSRSKRTGCNGIHIS